MKIFLRTFLSIFFAFSTIKGQAQIPSITMQPQSQRSKSGSNVLFQVAINAEFPSVTSGTLRLWLKADAGVATNSSGMVSQWQDQSGNAKHASQTNTNLQPVLVQSPSIGGQSALRFDGIQTTGSGDFLKGTGSLSIPYGYTSFAVYSRVNRNILEQVIAMVGSPLAYDSVRASVIYGTEMGFSAWGNDYNSGFNIPASNFRVMTHRLNTNRTQMEFFDTDGTNNFATVKTTSGIQSPGSDYYVGGLGSQTRNFAGDIAELIYFDGTLTESDRLAVETYLKQKFYHGGPQGSVTYQWQFNGTNIVGATNSVLNLSNVQSSDEGDYSVIVSNSFGSVVSSNAFLTLSPPPSITTHPQNQEAVQGANVEFTVTGSSSLPLSYQWRSNGIAISHATNSTFTITNVQPTHAASYSVAVSDGLDRVISSNATLTVFYAPTITMQPQSRTALSGTNVTIHVAATGNPLNFQWYFNETNLIAQATNASLALANITTNDAGTYSVIVSNSVGSTSSSNAILTVIDLSSPIFEDFESEITSGNWSTFSPVVLVTNYGGFVSASNSLWFGGTGSRFAATRPIDLSSGGSISFNLRLANGVSPIWDRPELPFDGIVFEYSLNGLTWFNIGTYNTTNFFDWTFVQPALPAAAQSTSTRFRWRQLANNGSFSDHWALDDIEIVPASPVPAIVVQPPSRVLPVGTNVTLSVQLTGKAPFNYQWISHSSEILSTNASLVLNNLQLNDSGDYSVVVANAFGSVTSEVAVITILTPPSISSHPQSQQGVQGTNIAFSVTATGSAPLSFQWEFQGTPIPNATNSVLDLTDIQSTNAGAYSVRVSNPVGSVLSSVASLTVDTTPVILTQPQSESVIAGSNVTFNVALRAELANVSSGALRLWLKADAGVVTNGSGMVSLWQDQSGNNNHASQTNVNLQPGLVQVVAIGNQTAVRFDGIQSASAGDYLKGTGDVGLSNAYTSFMVYSLKGSGAVEEVPAWIGAVGSWGTGRGYYLRNQQMSFATWGYDFITGFVVPTNTFRIWTDRFNTNGTLMEFFDSTATTSTNFSLTTTGAGTPAAGYFVGGFNPAETPGRNFAGDIAELIYFRGSLSEADRLAVEAYLKQKYYQGGTSGSVTYQWQFNGTNIVGATNSSLSLTNVLPGDAGNYSVIVSNSVGFTTSSNATLTVNIPPSIAAHPQGQLVNAGSAAHFTVEASGTGPFSYQWQWNSNNLAGATNSTLVLDSVETSDAGNYHVIVSSPFGTVASSNAVLSVNTSTVRVIDASVASASSFALAIELGALGTENALGFSLSFDPALLTFESVVLDGSLDGVALIANTAQIGSGKLGVAVALPANTTFTAGTQTVVHVTFNTGVSPTALETAISFVDSPTTRQISDVGAETLPSIFVDGTVAIAAVDYEGDVAPRPNGSRTLTITDWVQVGRFAAGLDTPLPGEFQRIDSAPRVDLGNGVISVTDWVQAGRYAAGVDPLTPVGGPTEPSLAKGRPVIAAASSERSVILETTNQLGQTHVISARLIALGNENAIGFSLTFDPAILTFISAAAGGNAPGALLNVNTNNVSVGRVGVALSLPTGSIFPAGTQEVIKLTFETATNGTASTTFNFADSPVLREVSDPDANSLAASFASASLIVNPGPLLTIFMSEAGTTLSWPVAASNFVLEATSAIGTNWATVSGNLTTNAQSISTTLPLPEEQQFYRLKRP